MKLITEAQVAASLSPAAVQASLHAAFCDLGAGRATVLPRSRAGDVQGGMVSAMGAVLPALDVLGTKVYATRLGQFQFLVNLFQLSTGLPLATLEGNELTRLRTAATTALAVQRLVQPEARQLAVFGAGVQAQAHVAAIWPLRHFEELLLCARSGAEELAARYRAEGLPARAVGAREAAGAAVVVTATRASEPLFDGDWVQRGALVAAVGSSKPVARELDDALLARAARLVVEWKPAAEQEAGEFRRAGAGVIDPAKLLELGGLLLDATAEVAGGITVYKSVGIGLEDVALGHAVLRAINP